MCLSVPNPHQESMRRDGWSSDGRRSRTSSGWDRTGTTKIEHSSDKDGATQFNREKVGRGRNDTRTSNLRSSCVPLIHTRVQRTTIALLRIMIFLTRMPKLEMMFGEGDLRVRYLKCDPALVWLLYEDFVKRIWSFLRFLKIYGKSWFIHVWLYLCLRIILGGNVKGRIGNSSKHFRHTLMHFQRTFHYLKVYQ